MLLCYTTTSNEKSVMYEIYILDFFFFQIVTSEGKELKFLTEIEILVDKGRSNKLQSTFLLLSKLHIFFSLNSLIHNVFQFLLIYLCYYESIYDEGKILFKVRYSTFSH